MIKITLAQLRDIIKEAVEEEHYKPTDLEMMASVYSDMYKDVHGIRPRHQNFNVWSEEKLRTEMDYLQKEINDQIEAEESEKNVPHSAAEEEVISDEQDLDALYGDIEDKLGRRHR